MRACQQRFGRRWRRSKAREGHVEVEAFWILPSPKLPMSSREVARWTQARRGGADMSVCGAHARSLDWFVWGDGSLWIWGRMLWRD